MEENKKIDSGKVMEMAEKSFFNFQKLLTTYLLNWKWFVLSLIICLGIAAIKLRYATPIYQSHAKLLVKAEDNSSGRGRGIQGMTNLGIMSNSAGLDNE
ncbi:MAG: capsid assembly protein, partial [Prevotella sp.]|nr:capsid assembly protein [Prevotella sp.]